MVRSHGSWWRVYASLSRSAPKHLINSHSSSDLLTASVLPLHSRPGPPTSRFPGGLTFNHSHNSFEEKNAFGVLDVFFRAWNLIAVTHADALTFALMWWCRRSSHGEIRRQRRRRGDSEQGGRRAVREEK